MIITEPSPNTSRSPSSERHRMLWIKARPAAFGRPFVLGLLHVEHGLRELFDIADMVGMGVRDCDRLDVRRLDAKLGKLPGKRLGPRQCQRAVRTLHAVRQRGERILKTRVPEDPALRVVDQVAIVRQLDRHPDVDAGRPARLVGGRNMAAVEDVELVDARSHGRQRVQCCRQDGSGERCELHDFLPAFPLARSVIPPAPPGSAPSCGSPCGSI